MVAINTAATPTKPGISPLMRSTNPVSLIGIRSRTTSNAVMAASPTVNFPRLSQLVFSITGRTIERTPKKAAVAMRSAPRATRVRPIFFDFIKKSF